MKSGAAALVALAALIASPALAEEQAEPDVAVRTMHDFAFCAVRSHHDWAVRMLATEPGSPEYRAQARRISSPDCLQPADDGTASQLRFVPGLLAGGMYEALYFRDFHAAPIDVSVLPPLVYPWDGGGVDPGARSRNRFYFEFGECVVRAAPDAAHALLTTRVTTPQERAAMATLQPQIASCIPQGMNLTFSLPTLRGLIAQGLYRLSAAARAGAGASRGATAR